MVNSSQGGGSKDTWVWMTRRMDAGMLSLSAESVTVLIAHAEPRRRFALLDEPLHRAGGKQRPHREVNLQLLLDLTNQPEADPKQQWDPIISSLEENEFFASLYPKPDGEGGDRFRQPAKEKSELDSSRV